jgi:hypothetical protein
MSPAMTGALLGFAVGFIGFVALRIVANKIESTGTTSDPRRAAALMRTVALLDWIIFTAIGFFLGPMFLQQAN